MQLNAFFPTRDIGTDPAKIRDWAQAAEDLGYAYIEVPDHVFGATARDGWVPLYNEKDPFHETFVTLGFLAAVTKKIGLSSGVLIAPQRQTGLIAKQAAEVDLLSGGRLRLGIGVGWNHVEYEALGADWKTRGARQAEQVEVLRRLWSRGPRDLRRPLPRSHGRQHRAAAGAASDPDLVWRHRPMPSSRAPRGSATAGCRSWRPTRRPSRSSALLREQLEVARTRPGQVRHRGLAAHARGGPASAGRPRPTVGAGSAPTW